MHRREFLALAGATLAAGVSTQAAAQAQSWPDTPVKLILPYARGGAGGMIGTEAASKAAPDGYTFLLTPNATMSVLPLLRKTAYDPVKSFVPVAQVGDILSGFVIHPAVGPKTFKEMVEYAKKNP